MKKTLLSLLTLLVCGLTASALSTRIHSMSPSNDEEPATETNALTLVSSNPADGAEVQWLDNLHLTFNQELTRWDGAYTLTNTEGKVIRTGNLQAGATTAEADIIFSPRMESAGQYTLTIAAGAVAAGEATNEEIVLHYNVIGRNTFLPLTITPENGTEVESLDHIFLTFAQNAVNSVSTDVLNVTNAEGEVVATATMYDNYYKTTGRLPGSTENDVVVQLSQTLTEAGTYTIVIPENKITQYNPSTYNPEIILTYNVSGSDTPEPPVDPEEPKEDPYATFTYTTVTPANGDTLSRLDAVTLNFPDIVSAITKKQGFNVLNANGEAVTTGSLDWVNYPSAMLTFTLANPITTAGTYTFTLDEKIIWNSLLDIMAEDLGVSNGARYNPALTFTFTIDESLEPTEPEDYPINFNKEAYQHHSTRLLNGITLQAGNGEVQTVTLDGTKKAYQDLTDQSFTIHSGDAVTVQANYTGDWMHTYVYVDLENDKQFSFSEEADQAGTDLLGYTYYLGYNNEGNATAKEIAPTTPIHFTLDAAPGDYRMRVKVDWDNANPGGNVSSGNHILNNGGHIVDITFHVLEPNPSDGISTITTQGQTQKIYTLDGRQVKAQKLQKGLYIIGGQKVLVK